MQITSSVLIIGGGLNGYLLACALTKANLSVTLVEEKPLGKRLKTFDGRAYAISFSSLNVLKALNLWNKIKENAQEINKMLISKSDEERLPSSASLEFDKSDLDGECIAFMVEDRHMKSVLVESLKQTSVKILRNLKAISFQQGKNKTIVELSNGEKVIADLLIAADGKKSEIADSYGLSRLGWNYQQKALVCGVAHEKAHNGTAYQIFYPAGPFAILPLKGQKSSIVWTEPLKIADKIMNMSTKDFLNCLKVKFGNFLGDIKLISPKHSFELNLGFSIRIISNRLALVGDSAQNIHPLAGQGLNLGIRDVACLAEILIEAVRIGEDIGSAQVLQRYEKWRGLDSTLLFAATDSLNRFFSSGNKLVNLGNGASMRLVNYFPPVKKFLMREAMGVNGDLPKLLRGIFP